jgi:hypothetical protein
LNENSDQAACNNIQIAYQTQLRAMTKGDTVTLASLLDEGFSLTHITGYRQPKAEWLAQMRMGQFVYHRISERTVSIDVRGQNGRLVGRLVTDATIYGTRANWRLQLAIDCTLRAGQWIALRSVASTW